MKIIFANSTVLHKQLEKDLVRRYHAKVITKKDNLRTQAIKKISPDYIFFIHWSYKIPAEIYENYRCIVFHMTDVPFGRGGSPLQNLVVRGFKDTKLSALEVVEQFDAGKVYLKQKLSLSGSAQQIFYRLDKIVEKMIEIIISKKIMPIPQQGPVTIFKRRTPAESDLREIDNLNKIYDYIRMLDADGYPRAFLETNHLKFEFSQAKFKSTKIEAYVRITKK
jgi:methionyl-tRNA formyltransferase